MASAQSERSDLHKYARYHRLCWPARTTHVNIAHDIPASFDSEALSTAEDQLPTKRPADEPLTEKLFVDSETGQYLASILKQGERRSASELVEEDSFRCAKIFKLETPALRTDPELDLCQFINRSKFTKLIDSKQFTLSTLAEAAGDDHVGLIWPAWCHKLPEQLENKCKSEKLQIDRESLLWLHSIISQSGASEADTDVPMTDSHPQRPFRSRFITPPLSPMLRVSDPRNEYASSPVAAPLVPGEGSPSAEISTKLDQTIFMEDTLSNPTGPHKQGQHEQSVSLQELGEIFPQIVSEGSDNPYLSPARFLASRLKLDETLLPVGSHPKTSSLTSEDLLELGKLPDFQENINSLTGTNDDIGEILKDCIGEEAVKVDKKIMTEKLQAADTTMRLKAPELDFSISAPPWNQRGHAKKLETEQHSMISWIRTQKLHDSNLYQLEKHLRWVPFPMNISAKVLQENLSDEDTVQDFISLKDLPDANFSIDTLVWKFPGLRVLDENLEDEELEQADFDNEPLTQGLLKKRKAEPEGPWRVHDNAHEEGLEERKPAARAKALLARNRPRSKPGQSSLFPQDFSATDTLKRFIWTKTGQEKRQKLDELKVRLDGGSKSLPLVRNLKDTQTSKVISPTKHESSFNSTQTTSFDVFSLFGKLCQSSSSESTITQHLKEITVLSSIISQYRTLFREILIRFPDIELVASDDESDSDSLVTQKQADITFGPGRGILLTTLQKIKQRPLPGHKYKDLSPIRSRILSLCKYYDNIFVIVSQSPLSTGKLVTEPSFALSQNLQSGCISSDIAIDTAAMSDDDLEAMSLLKAFAVASGQQRVVDACLVRGTINAMVECIVQLMTMQYAPPDHQQLL